MKEWQQEEGMMKDGEGMRKGKGAAVGGGRGREGGGGHERRERRQEVGARGRQGDRGGRRREDGKRGGGDGRKMGGGRAGGRKTERSDSSWTNHTFIKFGNDCSGPLEYSRKCATVSGVGPKYEYPFQIWNGYLPPKQNERTQINDIFQHSVAFPIFWSRMCVRDWQGGVWRCKCNMHCQPWSNQGLVVHGRFGRAWLHVLGKRGACTGTSGACIAPNIDNIHCQKAAVESVWVPSTWWGMVWKTRGWQPLHLGD